MGKYFRNGCEVKMDISKARINDIKRLKWLYEKYCNQDIPILLTNKMQLCNKFSLSPKQLHDLDNYLKAIRQDMRKIFLSINNIDRIYSSYPKQGRKELLPSDKETIAIYIEYIITKYRVIIEYTLKILDMVVEYRGAMFKGNRKKLTHTDLYNMKLDYLKRLISNDDRRRILNDEWFESIRKTRNSIIHNGATCLVFDGGKEKLFQIYNLEVDELIVDDFYLHTGNCIYFDYFISLNLANLIYFIDSIFSVVLEKIGYDYNEETDSIVELIVSPALNTVSDTQKCVMNWVDNIIKMYDKE